MLHKNITGSDNHEPKGIESASADQVYMADGAGSGSWQSITATSVPAYLTTRFNDISAASSAWAVSPIAGTVTAVYVVLHSGITVANSIVTGKIAGTPIGGLSITITQSGSAAGSTFSDTSVSGSNTVTAGQAIEIVSDGGSTTTAIADVTIVVTPS